VADCKIVHVHFFSSLAFFVYLSLSLALSLFSVSRLEIISMHLFFLYTFLFDVLQCQSWWRGVMVRRCLGPYKKKKKKGGKAKEKK